MQNRETEARACWADGNVTIFWDQPEAAEGRVTYTVLLEGREKKTDRTHCTFEDCSEHADLSYSVLMDDQVLHTGSLKTGARLKRLDVTDFGAVGDGETMNTKALQAAIDACGAGECVRIPKGIFLTGALRLHSDMALYLEEGATLQGTQRPEDYLPKIPSRFEGTEMMCYQSLLNLGHMDHASQANCENVLIYGHGTICGGGQNLAMNIIEAEKVRLAAYMESLGEGIRDYENEHTIPGRARGRLINLSNCRNVRITGLTLKNGASWNVHMLYSQGIVTDHCTFLSEGVWNGDGWDPDSSSDCTLFASRFRTGDDSVAIKSGKNPEGNRIARPTTKIRVFDCVSEYGLGIAIGSEMSGGVSDVRIWDCDLAHSLYGVQIKGTKKRGGYVRNVWVSDSILSRFLICAVRYNDDGEGAPEPPRFSDMVCRRVHFTAVARDYWEKEDHEVNCIECSGFDDPGYEATNLRFEKCTSQKSAGTKFVCCRQVLTEMAEARG